MRTIDFIEIYRKFYNARYNVKSWKNFNNSLVNAFKLDDIRNSTVLDYGCGFGLESAILAKNGNKVIISDITRGATQLTMRTMNLFGYKPYKRIRIHGTPPYFRELDVGIDYLIALDSLNYSEDAAAIMTEVKDKMKIKATALLMAPSSTGWDKATATAQPAADAIITGAAGYSLFKSFFAPRSQYVEFYSSARAVDKFTSDYVIRAHTEVSADSRYAVTELTKI